MDASSLRTRLRAEPQPQHDVDDDLDAFSKGALYKRKEFLGVEEEGARLSRTRT